MFKFVTLLVVFAVCTPKPVEAPPVLVETISAKQKPAPMRSGTGPMDVGNRAPNFYFGLALPTATEVERKAAGNGVKNVLDAMDRVGSKILWTEMLRIFPALRKDKQWISKKYWRIRRDQRHGKFWSKCRGRTHVFLAASYYPVEKAPIPLVRRRERDFKTQKKVFGYDVLYPIAGSYVTGRHGGSRYTLIEIYSKESAWWYSWTMRFQILERWVGGRLTVDYVDIGEDSYWAAGRDVWVDVLARSSSGIFLIRFV